LISTWAVVDIRCPSIRMGRPATSRRAGSGKPSRKRSEYMIVRKNTRLRNPVMT
jgi:hypothetical protein